MASKTVTNSDGSTKKVLVGSKADPASKNYVPPATTKPAINQPKESVAQTMAKSKAMLDQTMAEGTKSFKGSTFETKLNSTTLSPTDEFTTVQTEPSTKTDGVLGELATRTDQFQKNLQTEKTTAKNAEQSAYDTYIQSLKDAPTESGLTASEYAKKGGVDEIQQELNKINQDILVEQTSLERELEALDKNPQGLFGGALEDKKNKIKTESLRRQADYSLIQLGIQGRFDSAKAVADRAIDAQLESEKNKMEANRLSYERNANIFSTAEKREYEAAYNQRQQAFKEKEQTMKDISDLSLIALENGAPASVVLAMRQGKTLDDAIVAGSQYLRSTKSTGLKGLTSKDYRDMLREAYPEISSEAISQLTERELEDFVMQLVEYESSSGKFSTLKGNPITAMGDLSNYKGTPSVKNTFSKQTPIEFFKEYKQRIGKKISTVGADFASKINAAFGD